VLAYAVHEPLCKKGGIFNALQYGPNSAWRSPLNVASVVQCECDDVWPERRKSDGSLDFLYLPTRFLDSTRCRDALYDDQQVRLCVCVLFLMDGCVCTHTSTYIHTHAYTYTHMQAPDFDKAYRLDKSSSAARIILDEYAVTGTTKARVNMLRRNASHSLCGNVLGTFYVNCKERGKWVCQKNTARELYAREGPEWESWPLRNGDISGNPEKLLQNYPDLFSEQAFGMHEITGIRNFEYDGLLNLDIDVSNAEYACQCDNPEARRFEFEVKIDDSAFQGEDEDAVCDIVLVQGENDVVATAADVVTAACNTEARGNCGEASIRIGDVRNSVEFYPSTRFDADGEAITVDQGLCAGHVTDDGTFTAVCECEPGFEGLYCDRAIRNVDQRGIYEEVFNLNQIKLEGERKEDVCVCVYMCVYVCSSIVACFTLAIIHASHFTHTHTHTHTQPPASPHSIA
jgi:hypothetical protein